MYTLHSSSTTLLAFSNWPPRYLSEFLFGGPVAGPVIYYLFEILFAGQFGGQFAGQLPGQLSIIFLKSCSRASSRASYLISFRILGASSRSGQLLKASRVFVFLNDCWMQGLLGMILRTSTVRSLLSGKSFLLTHCHQIYIRKEISRPGFLDVSR